MISFIYQKIKEVKEGVINLVIKQRIILAHIDGMSNRAIANILHLSKDTVNKYVNEYNEKRTELLLANPEMDTSEIIQAFIEKPTYDSSNRVPSKATPELLSAIEKCLQLNRDKRLLGMQKQTMKKIDIHEYVKEQGFDVSYSTVKRATQYLESRHQEAYIRQEYMPGEICEFDWGTVKLDIGNCGYKKYQMAVFTSAYGNYRFAKLYLTQDTAAFQESHADFFAHSHGAFQTMVYDNMKVAVKRFVGLNEKEPTVALTELSIYYGFKYRFCNIASGNEKGHVERSVEYVRRKVFSGPECDKFDTLAEANKFLFRECMKLNSKEIYDGSIPTDTFETEKTFLLPSMPKFESCMKSTSKVDKYSTIMVARNHYSVPDTYVGKEVAVRLYTDKVVIYHNATIIAQHNRDYGTGQWRIDIYHYLRTLKRKPGALHQSTALLQSDTQIKNIYEKYYSKDTKTFLEVLDIIYEYGVPSVTEALYKLEKLSPLDMSADKVALICAKKEEELKQTNIKTDRLSEKSKSTLSQYDRLRKIQTESERKVV